MMLSDFHQRYTKGPHVGRDGVRLASDTLGGHVVVGANEGVGIPLCAELARHSKVNELYLPISAEENV